MGTTAWAYSDLDWKLGGKWGDLAQYIGRYEYDQVLNDKRVSAQLDTMLGKEEIEKLKARLDVRGSIGFDEDCLILSGNAPHQGGQEAAFVNVCIYKGEVHVAILSGGIIKVYSPEAPHYEYLPRAMKTWIYTVKDLKSFLQPSFVEMKN